MAPSRGHSTPSTRRQRRSSDGYDKIRPFPHRNRDNRPSTGSVRLYECQLLGRLACNKCQRPVSAACRLVTPKGEIAQRNQDDVGLLEQQVTEQAPVMIERGRHGARLSLGRGLGSLLRAPRPSETALDIASRAKGPRALESAARRLAKAHRGVDVRRDHRFLSFLRALRTRLIDDELGPAETANIEVALASLGCCSGGLDKDGRAFEGRAFASLGRRAASR